MSAEILRFTTRDEPIKIDDLDQDAVILQFPEPTPAERLAILDEEFEDACDPCANRRKF